MQELVTSAIETSRRVNEDRRRLEDDPLWPTYRRLRSALRRYVRAKTGIAGDAQVDFTLLHQQTEFLRDMRRLALQDMKTRGVIHV